MQAFLIALRGTFDEWVRTRWQDLQFADARTALLVFVEISLSSKSDRSFDDFRREILCIPQVQECHLVSGDFDYLVKARIGEIGQYRSLLGDILLRLPGVTQTKSCIVMEEVKETLLIPAQK